MREKGSWSDVTYASRKTAVKERGSATFEGEQRVREGKGLDRLVDPKSFDGVRGSNSLLVPKGDGFLLEFGVAMPVETDLDTTGSMGGNVDVAFAALPKVQDLLVQGKNAVLKRYHTQIATGVIQDVGDKFPYQRSQFEPDNEVERQMGLLVPEREGGDSTEDYQIGLFAAAYLTRATITAYGLRGYYFVVGDEIGRERIKRADLERVFGKNVLQQAFGETGPNDLPSTAETAKKVLENWHAFFLQVGDRSTTTAWWTRNFGEERVIKLPRTEDVAEVQAAIIGLTEGLFDLQSAADFLGGAKVSREKTVKIIEALQDIPVGLQTTFPNFGKIPMAGAKFASREDIWPIGTKEKTAGAKSSTPVKAAKGGEKAKKKKSWKV